MSKHNPHFIKVEKIDDAKNEIRKIGSDPKSIDIMAPKAILKLILLENVILQDAIIIKQDMLSVGGEVAVPKDTFKLHNEKGKILIIGTLKQLTDLVEKLDRHYSRLKIISKEIKNLLTDNI